MKAIILSFGIGLCTFYSFSQSTITITKTGTTPQIDGAIEYAGFLWSQYLNSTVPIKVNVIYTDLGASGALAVTFPNGEINFSSAPMNDLWYASCLANSIEGSELNPSEFDMDIYVNSSTDYYWGIVGLPAPGQYDLVTVLLHEMAHGLGVMSLSKYDAGVGSFGMIDETSIAPLVTSFPFPVLGGLPSIWDFYLENGAGMQLSDTLSFPNETTGLGSEFQSNDVWFIGPNATTFNGGTSPKVFAPTTFESGSSLQHFDESTFPASSGNGIMTPYLTNNEVDHEPGLLLLSALEDIGWSINTTAALDENSSAALSIYPNPSSGFLNLEFNGTSISLQLVDILGNVVVNNITSGGIDLSEFPNGTYLLTGVIDEMPINENIVLVR